MLPFGHIAISYLISQIPRLKGKNLNWKEVLFVILCGTLFDVDFFLLEIIGLPGGIHHYLPTHTLLFGIFYFLILYILLRKKLSLSVLKLGALAMVSHLVLDDLDYWFSLLGLEEEITPQIFWFYPFDWRMNVEIEKLFSSFSPQKFSFVSLIKNYITKTPKVFVLEVLFFISAFGVFLRKCLKTLKQKTL